MEIVEPYKNPFWKAITWRIIASVITMGLVYLTTGNVVQTLLVGIPESILKVLFYILHEMAWERWR